MRRVLRTCAPGALAALLLCLARLDPSRTEAWYARRVYPELAELIATPANAWRAVGPGARGPSLAELALAALALAFVWRAAQAWRAGRGLERAFGLVALAVRWGGWCALAFVVTWGANHGRRPLLVSLGWAVPAAEGEALQAAARRLAEVAADARARLAEDEEGVLVAPADWSARASLAWERAGARSPLLAGPAGPVVAPLAAPLLVAARVSGVFSPFTGEAHVVGDLPAVSLGFTACHELAHRRGFAREDEANALAFLVGVGSSDDYLVCSAASTACLHVLGSLRVADPAGFESTLAALPPALVRDLAAQRRYWTRERGALARAFGNLATATNDAYLRGMGTHDGVRSYGRMVDTVLAWWARGGALEWPDAPADASPRSPAARDRSTGR